MITLIGNDLAKKGLTFLFNKGAKECETCKFKTSCVESLEEGRMYKIIDVRDTQQPCLIHDEEEVTVVEIEKSGITTLINAKKSFEGSTLNYNPPECSLDCIHHDLCFPDGLKDDDKCTVSEILGKHIDACAKGYILNKVVLNIN
jgi:uncharacterized protein (UPF0179 family)